MIKVVTETPNGLLRAIREGIKDGEIETWEISSQGSFTHTPQQWRNEAWFRPSTEDNAIIFNIIRPKGGRVSREVYAIYHGRFSEMLLAKFDDKVKYLRLSALASAGDLV